MRSVTLIAAMLFVASACATHRELAKPEPAPATAATQSAPTAGTDTSSSGVNQELVMEGYRATTKHGQIMYCRTEAVTGTRFKSNVCLSEAQIMAERRNARDTLNAPRQAQCLPKGCGG